MNTGIQEYRNTGNTEYRKYRIQNTGNTEYIIGIPCTRSYRNTGIQEYRNTRIHEFRNT